MDGLDHKDKVEDKRTALKKKEGNDQQVSVVGLVCSAREFCGGNWRRGWEVGG